MGALGTPAQQTSISRMLAVGNWRRLCKLLLGAALVLAAISPCCAQTSFEVRNDRKQKWPEAEARKIYLLASQAVEREFRLSKPLKPRFTLVLGSEKDQMDVNTNELRLVKWNKRFFTEGVVLFAFEQMLPSELKNKLTHRVLSEAEATVSLEEGLVPRACYPAPNAPQ